MYLSQFLASTVINLKLTLLEELVRIEYRQCKRKGCSFMLQMFWDNTFGCKTRLIFSFGIPLSFLAPTLLNNKLTLLEELVSSALMLVLLSTILQRFNALLAVCLSSHGFADFDIICKFSSKRWQLNCTSLLLLLSLISYFIKSKI